MKPSPSNRELRRFTARRLSSTRDARREGRYPAGDVFTSDPQLAAQYARKFDFYRDHKLGRVLNAVTRLIRELNEGILSLFGVSAKVRGFVKRVSLRIDNPAEIDMKGADYDARTFTRHLLAAKEAGHDASAMLMTALKARLGSFRLCMPFSIRR